MIKQLIPTPIGDEVQFLSNIPQLNADPSSPNAEDLWVLKTGGGSSGGGTLKAFIGLGFPILSTGSGGAATYELSFRTKEGTTIRTTLS